MRHTCFFVVASGLAISVPLLSMSGCSTNNQTGPACQDGTGCDTSSTSSSGTGTITPKCKGDPTVDPTLITDECGVFVRGDQPGDDKNPGTSDEPLKTIQAAVNAVTDKWIFVCASVPFEEKVTIGKSNVSIFGGFDCKDGWTWSEKTKTTLQGLTNQVTLTVSGQDVKVQSFKVQAADATTAGASSIAVLVSTANPTFSGCEMIAGKAKDGDAGDSIATAIAPAGANGTPGGDACSKDVVAGAESVTSQCPAGEISIGGQGGDGNPTNGNPGVAGQPDNAGGGKPGAGEPSTGSVPPWSCTIGNGQAGGVGAPGKPGSGAASDLNLGSLTVDAFTPASGGDGTPGQPGQGGGGGGGAKGGNACVVATKGGASGGSGASGGCGGLGGRGGQGAGASIGLVSLASPGIILKEVILTAADGAKGGDGGDAQAGGPGGAKGGAGGKAGFSLHGGCAGGAGGGGGDGGPGGGGRGGHSIGLAYTDNPPPIETVKITFGNPGDGGRGGNLDLLMNHGDPGIAAATQVFTAKP